jgi:WD40 repeat protein
MRTRKIIAVSVVSVATLIVIAAAAAISFFFFTQRSESQQNFSPQDGQQAASPAGDVILVSRTKAGSSFLYRRKLSSGVEVRVTATPSGIESEPNFSHDGKLVVYTFAASPTSKAGIWVVGADGSAAHRITEEDKDALHPVFSPDDSTVYYAASRFTGNHSPIAAPARHEWDIFSVPIHPTVANAAPTQITHESFYDLASLDAVADGIAPGVTKLLISTTGYPIGALIEEFPIGDSGRNKIFQPHVPGESSVGPSFGEARFIHDGMDVLFLAASDSSGGNYDYNVYSMSDVTGAEIKQLTHLKGMTTELKVLPDGRATFVNGGAIFVLDIAKQTVVRL